MKFLKKINNKIGLNTLKKQVVWNWKFGTKTENYIIEYSSKPVDSKIINKIFDYLLKKDQLVDFDSLPLDEEFVVEKSAWKDYEEKIVGIFPKITLTKNYVLLTKKLDYLAVKKTFDGLIIIGKVKGLFK